MLSKKYIRSWSFMNSIVTEIVGILKSETNIVSVASSKII